MTMLFLATLTGATTIDARFPLSTETSLHVYSSRFSAQGRPLDEKQYAVGPGFQRCA